MTEALYKRLANIDDLKLSENYPHPLWNGELPNIFRKEIEKTIFKKFIKQVKMSLP